MVARNVTSGARGPRRAVPIPRRNPTKEIDFIHCTRVLRVVSAPLVLLSAPRLLISLYSAVLRVARGFAGFQHAATFARMALSREIVPPEEQSKRKRRFACESFARFASARRISQDQLTIFAFLDPAFACRPIARSCKLILVSDKLRNPRESQPSLRKI